MSKTVLFVLLKVLISVKVDILAKDLDSDLIQDNPVSENNDCAVIPECIESISKPTSPRAFVEFYNGFPNETDDISVTFRWNQPEFTDGIIQGYTVQCWFIENLKEMHICDDKSISATILKCTVHNLKPNTTYYFQVQAHTKIGASSYTDLIDVSTTHENPIPQLLTVSYIYIDIWDLDSKINVNFVKDDYMIASAAYSIAEHKIYWSNEERKLMMLEMNENNYTMKNITKITELQYVARHLCIDWIARNLYWVEYDYIVNYIIKLDLTMWENGIVKYDRILEIKNSFFSEVLTLLLFKGTLFLYYKTYEDYEAVYIQLDFDGKIVRNVQKKMANICPFSLKGTDFIDVKIDDMNTKKPLIYGLLSEYLIVTDINVSMCNLVLQTDNFNEDYRIQFHFLTIDKTNIYISIFYIQYIYVLKKKYAHLKSVDAFKHIEKIRASSSITNFYAFGKSLQSYPPMRCLTPDKKVYNVEESTYTVTTNSIIVNLPKPVPKSGCKKYNLPTIVYTSNIIGYCLDNKFNKFDNFTVQKYEQYYEISNLTPFTEYKLQLVISNYYSDQLSMDPLFSSEVIRRTKPGKLDAPENVTVEALTPSIALVYWMPSKKINCVPVIYEVHWTLVSINKTEHKINSKFSTIIGPLIPAQEYRIYVRIYPANYSDLYTDSLKTLYMYPEPNNITLNEVSINGMNISWIPSVNLTINYVLEYKNVEMQKWQIANNSEPNNGGKVMYYIKDLLPGTLYEFRLILKYPKYEKDFIWPSDGRFTFSTLTSDISSTPGILVKQYYLQITLSLVAVVTVICVCYFYYYRQCKKSNEQVLPPTMSDIELETLHEIPNIPNVQLNTLYSPMLEYNSDKYTLTEIKREEIRLEKLLGRGAFGMVKNNFFNIIK